MSVQAGIWNLGGSPVTRESLTRISQMLSDYGPDGESFHFDRSIGMLYRPFHTTAESRFEHQPHLSDSGTVITWDGRLDNRDELNLRLHTTLKDRTDVAIVNAAFDQWGTGCFAKLIGDWAISIWSPRDRELILARDYMGIRHLFYYPNARAIMWCSHLGPLALCGDSFSLCNDYIAGYLAFHPDAHLTPYREIHSVPPGKFVRIRTGKITTHTYWEFNTNLKTRHITDEEYEEHYRYLFRQAIRRRLRTDSPVLAELSGGLDSSSIVCMADDIGAEKTAQGPRVDTISYYDSTEPGENDLPYFTKIQEKRGRKGFCFDLMASGDSLRLDYPVFLPTPGFAGRTEVKSTLSELVSHSKYRIILSGVGGDEMNGQPLDPTILVAEQLRHLRLACVAKELTEWSRRMRIPWIQLLFQAVVHLLPQALRIKFTGVAKIEPWVHRRFASSYRLGARQIEATPSSWFLSPAVRDALQTTLTLARRMTYASPALIEKRYPYLDQNLVEFLTSIPIDQLLRPGQRRSLMRRALKDFLPPEIATRRTKAPAMRCYFLVFDKHWEIIDSAFRSSLSASLGYVYRDEAHVALLAMKNGQVPTYFLRLLKALSLELWLRDVVARHVVSIPGPLPLIVAADLAESRI